MPTIITPVPAFYDERLNTPSPCTPILTYQQELWGKVTRSSGLLADEILAPFHPRHGASPQVTRETPAPEFRARLARSSKPAVRMLSPTPYTKKPARASSRTTCSSDSSDESLTESSNDESNLSVRSEATKIPKPLGEPGRPGRGGYNLETALDWNHKTFTKFKKCVHALIDEHLDISKCSSAQSTAHVKVVRKKATQAFPDLEIYAKCWPVTDMIMMRLKYTSSRARKLERDGCRKVEEEVM